MMADKDPIRLYWWDAKPNFGDTIGPWMVELMTGRPVVNVRGTPHVEGERALATVGSLIQTLDRPGLSLWGTGAIGPLGPKAQDRLKDRRPVAVHAVRGSKTRRQLEKKLGWDHVPEVYGDPAYLLPRFYEPTDSAGVEGRISLVLHYSHRKFIKDVELGDRVHDVDVRTDGATVADQIASSSVCVSSSLHGVILAQAYEVPWVWLRVADAQLLGGDFKFEDAFTVLDASSVKKATVAPGRIDRRLIEDVARLAALPRTTRKLEPLLDAFPYERVR